MGTQVWPQGRTGPGWRHGVELSNLYIPRAVSRKGLLAVTVRNIGSWSGTFALRHWREAADGGSQRCRWSFTLSMRVGYCHLLQGEARGMKHREANRDRVAQGIHRRQHQTQNRLLVPDGLNQQ